MTAMGRAGTDGSLVLIVDDDTFVGRAVGMILRDARQARVQVARSGDVALPLAEATRPDLILVDVNMPGMGPLELCQRLRLTPGLERVPIYLLTGLLPEDAVLGPLREHVRGIINKPPDPTELVKALDAAAADG